MPEPVAIWLYRIIRIVLSVVFIWSGFSKLSDLQSFAVIIDAYGLLPDPLTIPAAILLSLAELFAGLGLFFDIRGSLASISIMLSFFMIILIYGIWLGLDIDCGCFGPDDPESTAFHGLFSAILRDTSMFAGIIYLYGYRYYKNIRPLNMSSILIKLNNIRR